MSESKGKHRASAMGHRFGPDLVCTECGRRWELHQVEPKVCEPRGKTEAPADPSLPPEPDDEDPD